MVTQRAEDQGRSGCRVPGGSHGDAAMLSVSSEAAAEQDGLDERLHHFLPARPGLGGAASLSLSLLCAQTGRFAYRYALKN